MLSDSGCIASVSPSSDAATLAEAHGLAQLTDTVMPQLLGLENELEARHPATTGVCERLVGLGLKIADRAESLGLEELVEAADRTISIMSTVSRRHDHACACELERSATGPHDYLIRGALQILINALTTGRH